MDETEAIKGCFFGASKGGSVTYSDTRLWHESGVLRKLFMRERRRAEIPAFVRPNRFSFNDYRFYL
jgi:hypothetical protein